jgi:hypothetical protein
MNQEQIRINNIARKMATALIKSGVGMIRSAVDDFEPITFQGARKVNDALDSIGGLTNNNLDMTYYFTNWDTWQKIVEVLYAIVKDFKWEAERFDCDQRSALMTSLSGLLFRLNTCAQLYCEVSDANTNEVKYLHWANLIVTTDGQCYLFDADNGGMTQKITSKTVVMGGLKYKLISIRSY